MQDGSNLFIWWSELELTPEPHDDLQRKCVRDFLGRFAPDAKVLHLADAARKAGEKGQRRRTPEEEQLLTLGVPACVQKQKLVDIIACFEARRWLFLVRMVHPSSLLKPESHALLRRAMAEAKAGRVYVTAFHKRQDFRRWAADISWGTEMRIADEPDHLIHFNGTRLMGPHGKDGCIGG